MSTFSLNGNLYLLTEIIKQKKDVLIHPNFVVFVNFHN